MSSSKKTESKKKNIHSSLLELYSSLKFDKLQLVSNSYNNNLIIVNARKAIRRY